MVNTSSASLSAPRRPSPQMVAACVCLGVLLFILRAQFFLLNAGFVEQSDQHYLFEAMDIRSPSWQQVVDAFSRVHHPAGASPYYQPLVSLSFLLDGFLLSDWTAAAFDLHAVNLALHLASVALLFFLIRKICGSTLWAALGALLFGMHPVQVETVAWVSQRGTLLATFFTLVALSSYWRYVNAGRWRWLLPVTLGYAAAVLSHPYFLGLPVVLLILDVWPLRRLGWRPILEKIPLFLMLIACGTLHYVLRSHIVVHVQGVNGVQTLTRNIAAMVEKLIWPCGLTPYRPFPFPEALSGLGIWVDAAVLVLLPASLILSFRYSRPIFAALAGAVVFVFPGLIDSPFAEQLLGDHYLYPALLAPLLVGAAWLKTRGAVLRRPWGRCLAEALAAVVLIFAVRTNLQTYCWQDYRELCLHTIGQYPGWSGGYVALVQSYIKDGDLDSALHYANRAVNEVPDDPSVQFYLGRVLLLYRDGRSVQAAESLQKALAAEPDWIDCLHYLGTALLDCGKPEEAIGYLERARELQPHSSAIRLSLGSAYLKVGRPASARAEFQEALREDDEPMAHLGLAKAWATNDAPDLARRHLAAAVERNPRMAQLAAQYPELRRLHDLPGFESLIDLSVPLPADGSPEHLAPLPPRTGPGV